MDAREMKIAEEKIACYDKMRKAYLTVRFVPDYSDIISILDESCSRVADMEKAP